MTVQVSDDNACSWLDQAKDLTDKWKEIHAPLLDELNDEIIFYARVNGDYLILNDGGETYANLESGGHGCLYHRLEDITSDFGEDFDFDPGDYCIAYASKDTDRPAAFNAFAVCLAACLLENPLDAYGDPKYDF